MDYTTIDLFIQAGMHYSTGRCHTVLHQKLVFSQGKYFTTWAVNNFEIQTGDKNQLRKYVLAIKLIKSSIGKALINLF